MDCILFEIEKSKEERIISSESATERKVYYGIAKEIIEKHKAANPWLNRDVLNNYKRLKTNSKKPATSVSIHSNPDVISDLTNSSMVAENENSNSSSEAENEISFNGSSINRRASKGGRPKGSTIESKRVDIRNRQQALNYAAMEAFKLKEAASKDGNPRVQKGTYKEVIEKTEKQFGLETGSIKMDTVLARLKQGRKLISGGRGNVSPLIAVEAHFLEVILQLALMHQYNKLHDIVNNLQDEVAAWKKKHNIPNKVFVTLDGKITENKQESIGRETNFLLTSRPNYVLLIDKVGCNTSQKSDGNVGGQKCVAEKKKGLL